jgi:hypothetical protein
LKVEDPAATFKAIDADGGGMILFDEFAHWAIQNKLDLEDDDDAEDAGAGSGLIGTFKPKKKKKKGTKDDEKEAVAPMQVDWAAVAAKLPWGKDEESSKKRKLLFRQFDPNGNGLLSLAEVDKAVCEDLQMGDVICKAVLIRAFNAAKGANQVCIFVVLTPPKRNCVFINVFLFVPLVWQ